MALTFDFNRKSIIPHIDSAPDVMADTANVRKTLGNEFGNNNAQTNEVGVHIEG